MLDDVPQPRSPRTETERPHSASTVLDGIQPHRNETQRSDSLKPAMHVLWKSGRIGTLIVEHSLHSFHCFLDSSLTACRLLLRRRKSIGYCVSGHFWFCSARSPKESDSIVCKELDAFMDPRRERNWVFESKTDTVSAYYKERDSGCRTRGAAELLSCFDFLLAASAHNRGYWMKTFRRLITKRFDTSMLMSTICACTLNTCFRSTLSWRSETSAVYKCASNAFETVTTQKKQKATPILISRPTDTLRGCRTRHASVDTVRLPRRTLSFISQL